MYVVECWGDCVSVFSRDGQFVTSLVSMESKEENLIVLVEFVLIAMVLFMFVIMGITEYKCFSTMYIYMIV